MPTGTPDNSFIHPYPIRVDDFSDISSTREPAKLYLLTHTHTDHLNGLASRSFGGRVVCSHDAKEMLLRHEVYSERALREMNLRAENSKTFRHLRVEPRKTEDGNVSYVGSRDLLVPHALHTPTEVYLSDKQSVTITLFDANHCPGAVMYLVEGDKGAVLHTGDFRAEPWFLESLARNAFLQRYLATPPASVGTIPGSNGCGGTHTDVVQTLDAIYLDTACLLDTIDVPTKADATSGLVTLMSLLPVTTLFFINAWTWGYEDILKAIAQAFRSKIHVDRYKHSIYSSIYADPFLRSIITKDAGSTRFHACERFDHCEFVKVDGQGDKPPYAAATANANSSMNTQGKHVVYVNPVTMGTAAWKLYLEETRQKLQHGERVNGLLIPLSRHSPLPELRAFVSLFRPKRVVPNTLDPALKGLDGACMQRMFEGCLAPDVTPASSHDTIGTANLDAGDLAAALLKDETEPGDVALKNIEGDGALVLAEKWAESGKIRKKLETMRQYLDGSEREFVNRVLGGARASSSSPSSPAYRNPFQPLTSRQEEPSSLTVRRERTIDGRATLEETARAMARIKVHVRPVYFNRESDEDTDDSDAEQERARTAHLLFADLANLPPDHPMNSCDPPSSPLVKTPKSAVRAARAEVVSLPENIPLTPKSRVASQVIVQPFSPLPTSRQLANNVPRNQPQKSPVIRPLGSPINMPIAETNTSSSLSRHGRSYMPTPDTISRRPGLQYSQESSSSIFAPAPPSRKSTTLHSSESEKRINGDAISSALLTPPSKRRKVVQEVQHQESASKTVVPLSRTLRQGVEHDTPGGTSIAPQVATQGCVTNLACASTSKAGPTTATPLSKSARALHHSHESLLFKSEQIAERLARARPDLVLPTYASELRMRQREVHQRQQPIANCQSNLSEVVPESPGRASPQNVPSSRKTWSPPSRLPSQDDLEDTQMDIEKSRELAQSFRLQMAEGRRPGLVIPRMNCLESQEEQG
ncbi:hypothetical protein OBBRIDRAFT_889439 [Obba rivulosa]|uniref:Protein artemis n=1 Tax=Obba rivulosa TaxID=1052685 RepID=A0A8E2ANI6_9APHY|nr:hypothetical protein OBBRIDRAFT_889439 [Obba rivulosa]